MLSRDLMDVTFPTADLTFPMVRKYMAYAEGIVTPVGAVTPEFVGQLYYDSVLKIWYRATGDTNADWSPQGVGALTLAELLYLDGLTAGTSAASKAMVRDADNEIDGIPVAEAQSVDPSQKFVLFEDFYGTWAIGDAGPADTWSSTAGGGTGNEVATTVANSVNGEITLKSASDDGNHAANCSALTGLSLGFKAEKGGLAMEARLAVDDISEAVLFVGFTDVISTTVELPIFLVAGDIDSDAANACGVGYDVDGTTEQFFHGGVKANTDTVPAYSGGAPADGVAFTVRVEVSAAGAVQGFINGTAIGAAVANAVTANTALTPAIIIGNRSANQVVATIDYIWVQQNR